jgi:hypothetical protein
MGKIALLALAMTCICAPAFSQEEGGVPVYPGGTTPTQTAPSNTGGVPNPVSPLGVDPQTQLPLSPSGQTTGQHRTECLPEPGGGTVCQ